MERENPAQEFSMAKRALNLKFLSSSAGKLGEKRGKGVKKAGEEVEKRGNGGELKERNNGG